MMTNHSLDRLLTKHVGEFGRYQRWMYLALTVSSMGVIFHNLLQVFTGPVVPHWCYVSRNNISTSGNQPRLIRNGWGYEDNASMFRDGGHRSLSDSTALESQLQTTTSTERSASNETSHIERKECSVVVHQGVHEGDVDIVNRSYGSEDLGMVIDLSNNDEQEEYCHRWTYDTSNGNSIVNEWDLVCGHSWLAPFAMSLHMAGSLVGSLTFGHFSDRFGRRKTLIVTTLIEVGSGVATAFSPNYVIYTSLRFLCGVAIAGQFNCVYLIALEIVGPRWRVLAAIAMMYFSSAGMLVLAGTAYFIRDWRTLQLVLSSSCALLLISCWIAPESPRWCITHGKTKRAKQILSTMARVNKKTLPDDLVLYLVPQPSKEQKTEKKPDTHHVFLSLLKNWKLRCTTLILGFVWFTNSISFYGLSILAPSLGGNSYINFALSGAIEIPAYTACLLTKNKFGRRNPLALSMILAGLTLLLTNFLPNDNPTGRIVCATIGKFGVSFAYANIYSFTAESFPTVVRNSAIGACAMCARIGGLLAPFALELGTIEELLPLLIFGCLATAGGFIVFSLPETGNRTLLETIEDMDRVKLMQPCFSGKTVCCGSGDNTQSTPKADVEVNDEAQHLSAV